MAKDKIEIVIPRYNEVDNSITYLRCNNSTKLFVYPINGFTFFDEQVNEVINNNYTIVAKNNNLGFLLKKTTSTEINCSNAAND